MRLVLAATTVVSLALVASPVLAAPGSPGGGKKPEPTTSPTPATATTEACYSLPDAAAVSTEWGRSIHTLVPHQGRIFYGYGDYSANTGSMASPYGTNISSLDPVDGTNRVHLAGFKTEAVHTYRTIGGNLYAPNIDPSQGADLHNAYASDAGEAGATAGTWAENPGAYGAVHVYDVARAGDVHLLAGSTERSSATDGAAVVWSSRDGGATWTESWVETEEDPAMRTGYERFYWMGTIGGKTYTRATLNTVYPDVPPMRVYDAATDTWGTVADSLAGVHFGQGVVEGNQVQAWRGRLWTAAGNVLTWFDGQTTAVVPAGRTGDLMMRQIAIGEDGLLYGINHSGDVLRIDYTPSTGKRKATAVTAVRVGTVPADAESFTVAAGRVWAAGGRGDAQVCSYPLG